MIPTNRDRQVHVILKSLEPQDCFEEVCQALRGLDYEPECLLEWCEKDPLNHKYSEREKLGRFHSFKTKEQAEESGDHARGFTTLIMLYPHDRPSMQYEASLLDPDEIEWISNDKSTARAERKPKHFTQYHALCVTPQELPTGLSNMSLEHQKTAYLTAMFKQHEQIYGTDDPRAGGLAMPVISAICGIGAPNYININPCNGENGNENVSSFRHTLIECDDVESLQEQYALLRASGLPITCVTDSAGKSLHAAVRVDAVSAAEYGERVDLIREFCAGIGINFDRSCRDSSRYTRCAGSTRTITKHVTWRPRPLGSQHPQNLISMYLGHPSYLEWKLMEYPKHVNRI